MEEFKADFLFVGFRRSMIKGEVVPLLGKWILIRYWSAARGVVRRVALKNLKLIFFSVGQQLKGKWCLYYANESLLSIGLLQGVGCGKLYGRV